jgi:hypothetical protein
VRQEQARPAASRKGVFLDRVLDGLPFRLRRVRRVRRRPGSAGRRGLRTGAAMGRSRPEGGAERLRSRMEIPTHAGSLPDSTAPCQSQFRCKVAGRHRSARPTDLRAPHRDGPDAERSPHSHRRSHP